MSVEDDRRDPEPAAATPEAADGPNPARMFLFLAAAVAVAFFIYRVTVGPDSAPSVGRSTGYDWEVVDLRGVPIDLEAYKGRPVFLNVWATWCGPCRMEMPSIQQLAARSEVKDADVAFLLVSVDQGIEPVRAYVKETGLDADATVLVAADNPPAEFQTAGIPATFILSPEGRIVRSDVGASDWNTDDVVETLTSMR